MNYADSFRKAQANYDAMEPPSDPPWLEDAAAEAFDDIVSEPLALMQALNETHEGQALRFAVSNLVCEVIDAPDLPVSELGVSRLREAIQESAVARALEKARE